MRSWRWHRSSDRVGSERDETRRDETLTSGSAGMHTAEVDEFHPCSTVSKLDDPENPCAT